MRVFFFILWEDEMFFYEDDEPLKMYGPYDGIDEAIDGLEEVLLGKMVDYWELPPIVISEGSEAWN